MGKIQTDRDGFYSVSGYASDLVTSIDPVVEIKFSCETLIEKCYRFEVPDEFLSGGQDPSKTFKAADIELSSVRPNC